MTGDVKLHTGMTPSSLVGNQPHLAVGRRGWTFYSAKRRWQI